MTKTALATVIIAALSSSANAANWYEGYWDLVTAGCGIPPDSNSRHPPGKGPERSRTGMVITNRTIVEYEGECKVVTIRDGYGVSGRGVTMFAGCSSGGHEAREMLLALEPKGSDILVAEWFDPMDSKTIQSKQVYERCRR